jgi:hypothetical protein
VQWKITDFTDFTDHGLTPPASFHRTVPAEPPRSG